MSLTELFQLVVVIFGISFTALAWAAGRWPDVEWLRPFRMAHLTTAQRERNRKRAERMAGVEILLLGFALPLGYLILTVMTFSSINPWWFGATIVASVACIVVGATVMVKNWR